MDTKTAAIVLCAGMGSRTGLPPGQNKCAAWIQGTSPIRHSVASLLQAGADRITVVVGYASDSVRNALTDYGRSGQVEFAENQKYDWHGCNYSLACGMAGVYADRAERVLIAEGDSLLNVGSIKQLVRSTVCAASLVRSEGYVDNARSVIAIGEKKILRYEYDTAHTGSGPDCSESERIIGDSMQLWSFTDEPLKRLKDLLREYRKKADEGETPFVHSGVYSINMLGTEIEPVFSDYPDDWINLNTQEDLRKAGSVKWLIK